MFERICGALSLGKLAAPPVRLHGGFTHRMFRVTTTQGDYAMKLLNPEIMQRPHVLDNFRGAEEGETLLEKAQLPILPARRISGRKLQCVDGQYLYVFDYFDGHVLPEAEITPMHCIIIGEVLARMHRIDRREGHAGVNVPVIDWTQLAENLLRSSDAGKEGLLLQSSAAMLARVTAAAEQAARRLPGIQALCHNDMDPKNVLWRGMELRIIDLECVGYANPAQEMLDLAIAWSGGEESRFKAFVRAYAGAGGDVAVDAALLYDSRRNYLDWLEYNARRALFDDPRERGIAREQIQWTVEKICDDLTQREKILQWMEEIQMKNTLKAAACGLDCNACNLYKAAFDSGAAEALVDWFHAKGWIGPDEGAEAVQRQAPFCMGCWDVTAKQWCGDCRLRACCAEHARADCGECAQFPCADYRAWTVGQAHHQAAMETLLKRRQA